MKNFRLSGIIALILAAAFTIVPCTAQSLSAHTSTIRVMDSSGAPFPGVLVIVKSLDTVREELRALTNSDGTVPPVALHAGLYRIITTCPYGLCKTSVTEVLGESAPQQLTLVAPIKATDADGELIGSPRASLVFEDPMGHPLQHLKFLVRDPTATWERWYSTDTSGKAEVEIPADSSVVVVVSDNRLVTITLASPCKRNEKSVCVEVPPGSPIRVSVR